MKPDALSDRPQVQRKALAGLRVIDAATFVAAPFSATLLGEFGADVIKVEQPGTGDPLRAVGTITEAGHSLNWASESRNKRTITLNLREKEGADILKKLVAVSDVLMENFRPGTFEKWGLGYDVLREINPRLVMLRLSAFGQTGPYRDQPGFARTAHAFSGLTFACGEPGRVPVTPGASMLADYSSGVWGAYATMVALMDRVTSGEGQCIDLPLYLATFRAMDEMVPAYAKTGAIRQRMGAETHNLVPHGHFRTCDDRWIALTCSSDKMFERLAGMIGDPVLLAPEMATTKARIAARENVNRVVIGWIGARTAAEVRTMCDAAGMPCSLIYNIEDIFNDPHYAARGDLLTMDDPVNGEVTVPAPFPKLSATPGEVRHLGLPLGASNHEVYGDLLGLSDVEIDDMKARGII